MQTKETPIDIVGSSIYGRDPKIQASRTFNMIIADDWLVGYGGYRKVAELSSFGVGRGIFTSTISNKLIVVINNNVYEVSLYSISSSNIKNYTYRFIGSIDSFYGDVFIDENINHQIALCDKKNIYIYNYITGDFQKAILPDGFIASYVSYHDGRFIATDSSSAIWALSAVGNGLNWFSNPATGGLVSASIQTKPDSALAAFRVPGRGNLIFVMGSIVTEAWTDVGSPIFPYQRSSSLNIDYGCVNQATIAASDNIVAWLGYNEKSGPVIMFSSGADIQQASTDGMNYRFNQLVNPQKSIGFFVKLSGHLIYQLTFYDPKDNYTILYDFTTQKVYDATDEKMNYHIARRVAFFENDYYFVSLNDGNLYQMGDEMNTYDYGLFGDGSPKVWEIPRVRVCSNLRMPKSERFVIPNVNLTLEQGNDTLNTGNDPNYNPRIGLCLSKDGGYQFGSYVDRPIYRVADRINKCNWWNLGSANDCVMQFRFYGKGPWRVTTGTASVYK